MVRHRRGNERSSREGGSYRLDNCIAKHDTPSCRWPGSGLLPHSDSRLICLTVDTTSRLFPITATGDDSLFGGHDRFSRQQHGDNRVQLPMGPQDLISSSRIQPALATKRLTKLRLDLVRILNQYEAAVRWWAFQLEIEGGTDSLRHHPDCTPINRKKAGFNRLTVSILPPNPPRWRFPLTDPRRRRSVAGMFRRYAIPALIVLLAWTAIFVVGGFMQSLCEVCGEPATVHVATASGGLASDSHHYCETHCPPELAKARAGRNR